MTYPLYTLPLDKMPTFYSADLLGMVLEKIVISECRCLVCLYRDSSL